MSLGINKVDNDTTHTGHNKYPSLENYKKPEVQDYILHFGQKEMVMTEKLHGSNGQIKIILNTDGTITKQLGRRNDWIKAKEKFYNFQTTVAKIDDGIDNMVRAIARSHGVNNMEIVIFGEIFGGGYDGKSNGIQCQNGVHYCPENDFAVFDITINGNFQAWDIVKNLCSTHGLRHVPEINRGLFLNVTNMFNPNDFKSIVSQQYGLPYIEGPKTTEGVVIRELKGDGTFGRRIKWKQDWALEYRPAKDVTPKAITPCSHATTFMNYNRFNCYRSKVGDDEISVEKKMTLHVREMVADTLIDIEKEYPDMSSADKKKVTKTISGKAFKMIKGYIFHGITEEPVDITPVNTSVDPTSMSSEERMKIILDDHNSLVSQTMELSERLNHLRIRLVAAGC
jgi:Rnl2 family RNA ligase